MKTLTYTLLIVAVAFLFAPTSSYASMGDMHRDGEREKKELKDARNDRHDDNDSEGKIKLRFEKELSPRACGKKLGAPYIWVTHTATNGLDIGEAGNWALDDFTRTIRVWETAPNHFCAIVEYEGIANAVEGQTGPGGEGVIGKNVHARATGGYRVEFDATKNPTPLWPTTGFVGDFEYGCLITDVSCPGPNWFAKYYLTLTNADLQWWGFIYKAGRHGTWINSIYGTKGNIL